jgi:hypothetical protein
MPGTNDGQELRQHCVQSILTAEGVALKRDPGYLAQIRARKAVLQAEAALLQAQTSGFEVAGAADQRGGIAKILV